MRFLTSTSSSVSKGGQGPRLVSCFQVCYPECCSAWDLLSPGPIILPIPKVPGPSRWPSTALGRCLSWGHLLFLSLPSGMAQLTLGYPLPGLGKIKGGRQAQGLWSSKDREVLPAVTHLQVIPVGRRERHEAMHLNVFLNLSLCLGVTHEKCSEGHSLFYCKQILTGGNSGAQPDRHGPSCCCLFFCSLLRQGFSV